MAAGILGTLVEGAGPLYVKELQTLFTLAQRHEGVSVVPIKGRSRISPSLQARLVTSTMLSGAQWSKLRQAFGSKDSGRISREVLRREHNTLASQPGRQAAVNELGARLVRVRGALECLLEELVNSCSFTERHVRGLDGVPIPHTETFTGAQGLEEMHSDATADVHVCLGLDKGGKTSSCKLVMTVANQRNPQRRQHSILLATYPCMKDGPDEVASMIGPWVEDLTELIENGVTINDGRRAVRLFFNGDYAFLSTFCGHKGATGCMSCLWCLVVRRPSVTSSTEAALYGSMQLVSEKTRKLRSRSHLVKMMAEYAEGDNDTLPAPNGLDSHFSIERRPNFPIDADAIVPIPLHISLGVTSFLLQLGITAAVASGGEPTGQAAANSVGWALLDDVRVRPVPYHGGGFEGRSCHQIAAKATIVCDSLAPHVSAESLWALREAWASWVSMVGVLNRAKVIPLADITTLASAAASFVRPLLEAFPWVSVTVKLHALAHHVPAFLRRYGSLGIYGEQALEAWHGYFNQAGENLTADCFLKRCLALLQHAAIGRDPSAELRLDNGQHRKAAAAGARRAVKPGDRRLRANKDGLRSTTAESQRDAEHTRQWSSDRVKMAVIAMQQHEKDKETQPQGTPDASSEGIEQDLFDDVPDEEEFDPVALFLLGAPLNLEC